MARTLFALMRVMSVVMLPTLMACSLVLGLEEPKDKQGGGGGSGGAGGANASNGIGGASASNGAQGSGSASSSSMPSGACDPTNAVCRMANSRCIGLVENKGKTDFALRVAQLSVTKPAMLATGFVGPFVSNGIQMNLADCNLHGTGTFNLLLEFNTTTNKLKAGGAFPASDPTQGYSFVNQGFNGINITPLEVDINLTANGTFSPSVGKDVVLPIYLSVTDTDPALILPIHQALISGKLSDDNNCIGSYDAAAQDPTKNCQSAAPFTTAASLDGFINLEEADSVIVTGINTSLCVVIGGTGNGSVPTRCTRTNNMIDFKGDWCTSTNMAANPNCFNAMKLTATLAASSVKLLGPSP